VTGSSPIGGTIEVAKYIIDGITTGNWYDGLIEAFGPIGYLIDSISTGDWNHAFETEMDSNAMEELVKFAAKEGNEDILSSTAALKSALEASENETLMRLASDSRMLDAIVKNADSVEALTTEL
jgi:hypothetical protein